MDRERYDRQLRVPGVGPAGQQTLADSSVLVVGAGGLGSPVIYYLSAAGVGRIGIADDDVVARSNLNRQIVHREADVGAPKVVSAARAARELNPEVRVETFTERVDASRLSELARNYDVVVDATDGFGSKLALNDGALAAGKPLVHGGVEGWSGQLAVLARPGGPCLRCLFPDVPAEPEHPRPIIGAAAGALGAMQAAETLKVLLGMSELEGGRLIVVDLAKLRFHTLRVAASPDCPACGPARSH